MPDVRDRIAVWRRPFEESVLYSSAAIDELEDHVWSLVAKSKASGASASESVETALAEVGTESVLREGFLVAWTEMSVWRRWRQRLNAESRSTSLPAVYRVLRIGSLGVGLFGRWIALILIGPAMWVWELWSRPKEIALAA